MDNRLIQTENEIETIQCNILNNDRIDSKTNINILNKRFNFPVVYYILYIYMFV